MNIKHVESHYHALLNSVDRWQKDGAGLEYPDSEKAGDLLVEVEKRGLYKLSK